MKTDVDLQIPKKKELLVYCPMSKLQQKLYRATVDRSIGLLLGVEVTIIFESVLSIYSKFFET